MTAVWHFARIAHVFPLNVSSLLYFSLMKISFKKVNKVLLIVQISALVITILMIVKAMKMLFPMLTGAVAH
jgi:hypothetical protein